jgi:hypothetical protein
MVPLLLLITHRSRGMTPDVDVVAFLIIWKTQMCRTNCIYFESYDIQHWMIQVAVLTGNLLRGKLRVTVPSTSST